jgi:hypothetical protein
LRTVLAYGSIRLGAVTRSAAADFLPDMLPEAGQTGVLRERLAKIDIGDYYIQSGKYIQSG